MPRTSSRPSTPGPAGPRPVVELVPIAGLHMAPWNPRRMTRERLENLKTSLERDPRLLWLRPPLAMKDGTVYAGNYRYAAAEALGPEWRRRSYGRDAIPAVLEDIALEEAKQRALRDNNAWGEWDEESLAELLYKLDKRGTDITTLGFEEGELERLIESVAGPQNIEEDVDLTPPAHPVSRPGDIYEMGPHRLVVGDCTEEGPWRALLGEDLADVMWTDPPYGVDYVGKTPEALTIDNDDSAGTRALLRDAWARSREHLRPGGGIYVATPGGSRMGIVFAEEYDRAFHLHQTLVWIKDAMVLGHSDYHFQHENVIYGWLQGAERRWYGGRDKVTLTLDEEPDPAKLDRKELVALVKEMRAAAGSDVRRHDRPKKNLEHPTMKPPELIRPMLANSTKRGDLVVDPFAGSGSTMVACEELRRRCAMLEVDPRYADVIVRRWEALSDTKAKRTRPKRAAA